MFNVWVSLLYKLAGRSAPLPLARSSERALAAGHYALYSADGAQALTRLFPAQSELHWVFIQSGADAEHLSGSGVDWAGLVIDGRSLRQVPQLELLLQLLQPKLRRLRPQSPIVLLSDSHKTTDAEHSACQAALTGFTRSLAKEVGAMACRVNLLDVAGCADAELLGSLRFFLSPASAYISGQCLRLTPSDSPVATLTPALPLQGKTALVTGASRGIGRAIACGLAAAGARVIGLDLPAAASALDALMQQLNGQSLCLDLTAPDAAQQLMEQLNAQQLQLDILVHNAGVTRDKTLKNMRVQDWQLVLQLNLQAQISLNQALLLSDRIRPQAAFVSLSSINGLAGQRGQTNYASAKAGLSGYVQAMAKQYPQHRFNAVAPGFIRTEMTARMPFLVRELGQRLNSLGQAGEPCDVAQAVLYLVSPDNKAVNAQVLRVCGQSLIGA